jgi:hypothetical protein
LQASSINCERKRERKRERVQRAVVVSAEGEWENSEDESGSG